MSLSWSGVGCASQDVGIKIGGAYQWQVTAHNGSGTTTGPIWHLSIQPYAPTNLSATAAGQSQINLSWKPSGDYGWPDPTQGPTQHYNVYENGTLIANPNEGTGYQLSDLYQVSGLTCGTSYSFSVTFVYEGVESLPSSPVSVATGSCGAPPTAPANPSPSDSATVARSNDTTLSWNTNGTTCDVHVWGGSINIDPLGGTCSSLHLGQQYGGAYQWQVTAHNGNLSTTGPTWHLKVQPNGPTNLSASAAGQTQINLSWTKSSDDPGSVDKYNVYQNGSLVASPAAGSTSYQAASLGCGQSYSFYTTAVRQGMESAPSNTANATTQACTSVTVNSAATYNASWAASSAFNTGDVLRMVIVATNNMITTQTGLWSWTVTDPGGNIVGSLSYENYSSALAPGANNLGLSPTIPASLASGTYTFQGKVSIGSSTDAKQTTFTVTNDSCYTLTTSASPSSGGTITPSPGPNCGNGTGYSAGTPVQLTAKAAGGYGFAGWSGDASDTSNPITVTMSSNKSVTASFTATSQVTVNSAATYNASWAASSAFNTGDVLRMVIVATNNMITTQTGLWSWTVTDPGGNIVGSLSYENYSSALAPGANNLGLSPTIPASLASGTYTFQGKVSIGSSTDAKQTTFTVTNDSCYTLTTSASPSSGGTITPSPGPNCGNGTGYSAGTPVQLTAKAAGGYGFAGWSGDASDTSNPITVTMSSNKSVTASFTATSQVTVNSAATYNASWAASSAFNLGDVLRLVIVATNNTATAQTGLWSWTVTDPGGHTVGALSYNSYSSTLAPGANNLSISPNVPAGSAFGTYTFQGKVSIWLEYRCEADDFHRDQQSLLHADHNP